MPGYRMSSRESSSEPYGHGLVGPPGTRPIRNGNGDGDGNGDGNGGPSPNPNFRAVAVEATQATQFFNFNGQGSGYAPDNSVPLVAGLVPPLAYREPISTVIPAVPVPP